jgi:hypothetical protein
MKSKILIWVLQNLYSDFSIAYNIKVSPKGLEYLKRNGIMCGTTLKDLKFGILAK